MNYLQITQYGNTIQEWLISLAILILSVIMARYAYYALRRTVFEWLNQSQTVREKETLTRICALTTYLIPMVGFALAHNRLLLDKELTNWLNIGLLIAGQITFLLILITIIELLVETLPIKYMRSARQDDRKFLQAQKEAIEKIRKRIKGLGWALLILVPVLTVFTYKDRVSAALWAMPGMIVLIKMMYCVRIVQVAKRKFRKPEITTIKFENALESEPARIRNDQDIKIKETVVEFFLDIFKYQLSAPKESPTEFLLVDSLSFAPNYIYELRVKMKDDWQSRRMTIGPLGDDTTSRSKCFYVIYDYHLVIKIPPTPITDLNEYMNIIKKDRSIVDQLSMQECIIPSVSVILKMLQQFFDGTRLPLGEIEENYVKWLNIFSDFQKYLKIDDTFVFFMDLSKYYFLQNILDSFHTAKKTLYDEICLDSEIAWDSLKLEEKYGRGNLSIFFEVEKIYRKYEFAINKLIEQYELSSEVSQYKIKEWFFIRLSGRNTIKNGQQIKTEFITALNKLIDKIVKDNLKTINFYRAIVKKHVREFTFIQNKAYMEGIITNLLELLTYLRKKRVAMRDLKPDNLLVAGDRERYPAFLAYPEKYKIGLIDVETAVILTGSSHRMMAQPLLGGTPQYATPSHLFSNQVLNQVYEDLSFILHLQDWHAVIAMIYKTAVGDKLFDNTSLLFPKMVATISQTPKDGDELSRTLVSVSQMFWNSAVSEFETKMAAKQNILKSLHIYIANSTRSMLKDFVLNEKQEIAQRIDKLVNAKDIPISARERQYLLACSHEKAYQLKKNLGKKPPAKAATARDRGRIVSFLENLARLKLAFDLKTKVLNLLAQSDSRISAYELLEIMFDMVLKNMYRVEWRALVIDDCSDLVYSDADARYQTTVEATRTWPTVPA